MTEEERQLLLQLAKSVYALADGLASVSVGKNRELLKQHAADIAKLAAPFGLEKVDLS